MTRNPNWLVKTSLHLQKKIYEKLYTKENVSKSAINELLNRTPNH